VEVRPYRIRLSSVLVNPVGPDGKPWTEPKSAPLKGGVSVPPPPSMPNNGQRGQAYRDQLKGYTARLPAWAKPNLVVDITLPDGRVLRAGPKNDTWVTFDGWFVLNTNQMDARPLLVSVKHRSAENGDKDLGTVSIPLGALISGAETPPTGAILWVDLSV